MILAKRVLLRLLTGDCGGQFLRSSFFLRKDWCYFISYIKQNRTLNHLYVSIEVNEISEYLPFIDTLESFEEVVETCFRRKDWNLWEKMDAFEAKLQHNYSKQMPYHFHPCQRIHFCQENSSWPFIWTSSWSYSFQMDPNLGKQLQDQKFR